MRGSRAMVNRGERSLKATSPGPNHRCHPWPDPHPELGLIHIPRHLRCVSFPARTWRPGHDALRYPNRHARAHVRFTPKTGPKRTWKMCALNFCLASKSNIDWTLRHNFTGYDDNSIYPFYFEIKIFRNFEAFSMKLGNYFPCDVSRYRDDNQHFAILLI